MRRSLLWADGGMRRGMALVIVFIISALLLIAALALWSVNEQDTARIPIIVRRLQAKFLAHGATQLALLKVRFCVTPFYHASYFSVGRNPFYPHAAGYAHLTINGVASPPSAVPTVPGPAFVSGSVMNYTDPRRLQRLDIKKIPSASGAMVEEMVADMDGDGMQEYKTDEMLVFFRLDIADRTYSSPALPSPAGYVASGQPNVAVSTSPPPTPNPKFSVADPYSGEFRVVRMMVMGTREKTQYQDDAILIEVVATVHSSIKGHVEDYTVKQKKIFKARRRFVP